MSKIKKYIQEKMDRLTKGYLQRGEKGNLIVKAYGAQGTFMRPKILETIKAISKNSHTNIILD